MARMSVLVCDRCSSQAGVKHFDIREGSRRGSIDLCEEHAAPLEAMLSDGEQIASRGTNRGRMRTVMTMEEIEALKRSC